MNNLMVHRVVIVLLVVLLAWLVQERAPQHAETEVKAATPAQETVSADDEPYRATPPASESPPQPEVGEQKELEEEIASLQLQVETLESAHRAAPAVVTEPAKDKEAEEKQRLERWLADFDRAMDREFGRLDQLAATVIDPEELEIMSRLKGHLEALDRLWIQIDAAPDDATRKQVELQVQGLQAQIIQAGQQHRQQRLQQILAQLGVTEADEVRQYGIALERAFRETDLKWTELLNRAR